MNIHPLFVHFPVALLVMYSLLELVAYAWPSLRRQSWVFPVKTYLLFTGVLGAFAALVTGGIAEDLIEGNQNAFIIGVHAPFAVATTGFYVILASAYMVRLFDKSGWGNHFVGHNHPFLRIWNFKKYVTYLVLDTWLLPVLATVALVTMFVTGILGAILVYGPGVDPVAGFVYHLFWR